MGKTKIKKLGFSFLPIPEELMKSKAISWGAKYLWGIIAKANMEEVRWGIKYMSERMGCEGRETRARIKELKENDLIMVKRTGRANIYKINFELVQLIQEDDGSKRAYQRRDKSVPIREAQIGQDPICSNKELSLKSLSDKPTNWNLEKELEKLLTDPKRHIEIIGIWIREMKLRPENKDQMQAIIKRFLRPAKLLEGYKNKDIVETIKVLKNTSYLTKFTPETISKYIDEVVANKKKEGPNILRFEKIEKPDGSITMRPIYAKSINL